MLNMEGKLSHQQTVKRKQQCRHTRHAPRRHINTDAQQLPPRLFLQLWAVQVRHGENFPSAELRQRYWHRHHLAKTRHDRVVHSLQVTALLHVVKLSNVCGA